MPCELGSSTHRCRNWGTSLHSSRPLHCFWPRSTRCQHARIKKGGTKCMKKAQLQLWRPHGTSMGVRTRGKDLSLFFNFPPKVGTVRDGDIYINMPAWVPYQLACLGALPTCLPGCPTNLPAWVPYQLACLGALYQLACLGALPTCLPGCPTNLPAWVPYQLACLGALPTCLPGCPTNLPAWVPYQLACLGALPTCLPMHIAKAEC